MISLDHWLAGSAGQRWGVLAVVVFDAAARE